MWVGHGQNLSVTFEFKVKFMVMETVEGPYFRRYPVNIFFSELHIFLSCMLKGVPTVNGTAVLTVPLLTVPVLTSRF